MKVRTTNYKEGAKMKIVDSVFHNYRIGQIVIIRHKDLYSYHVCDESGNNWWWVHENQIQPA